MKISRKWLTEFAGDGLPAAPELAALLTARGLEVDAVRPFAPVGGPVVAAEVVEVREVPGAKRLRQCVVRCGAGDNDRAEVVCGAPNVRAGMLGVLARPGANLGELTIAAREIRGVQSQGMLCAAAELGVAAEADKIMELSPAEFVVGQSVAAALALNDDILEVAVTPNRGDCVSHLGVAREVAAALDREVALPAVRHFAELREKFPVEIDPAAVAACPYYGCVVLRDVAAAAPSFWRVRSLLERCGLRAMGAAVDATNYLALAVGQPLHAFDLEKLSGGIRVRFAGAGEKVKLLVDDIVAECEATDLLIADHKTGVALGGVMGGADSAVSESTRHILLEAAHFAPAVVRGRTRRFGISSEAAFRFERGVDFKAPPSALALAAALIRAAAGGRAGPVVGAGKAPAARKKIVVLMSRVRDLSGARDLRGAESAALLRRMGIAAEVRAKTRGGKTVDEALTVAPPSWRFDLEIPEDLVEEILRARGYDKLTEEIPSGGRAFAVAAPAPFSERRAREFWAARGWREIITYAFIPPAWEHELHGTDAPVELANPISAEWSAMRSGLWGGLLDRARFNLHRGAERLRLFESGGCFFPVDAGREKPREELHLSGLALGAARPAQWGDDGRTTDFFDVKGALEEFLAGAAAEFVPLSDGPVLHPGRAARVLRKGKEIGRMGELHPQLAARWEFRAPPLLFDLNLSALAAERGFPRAREFSRLPQARRDLAIVVDDATPAGAALATARRFAAAGELEAAELFDLHRGGTIAAGRKGLGLRLTLRGRDENLTDAEIAATVGRVADALRNELGAELRDGSATGTGGTATTTAAATAREVL